MNAENLYLGELHSSLEEAESVLAQFSHQDMSCTIQVHSISSMTVNDPVF